MSKKTELEEAADLLTCYGERPSGYSVTLEVTSDDPDRFSLELLEILNKWPPSVKEFEVNMEVKDED